ncbi:peptidylprolyl isomerase domain and WD repeat-containing protein 1-like [Clavelina lepadiformis]|uniref:peptidylprolyl isomerase domain and WD repeat-containing protein 1-like n=1 Tax=Clavelina lepadiformis TaxID=159417 RepID=UPI004042CEE2
MASVRGSVKRTMDENGESKEEEKSNVKIETEPKKRKTLEYEQSYLENIPDSDRYEKSYMHRDNVTQVCVTKTDFIITASQDGHVKFWKKSDQGIEFVKHFRAHLAPITSMAVSYNGELMCSVSSDEALKVFDVINFDMINMLKLGFKPSICEWVFSSGDRKALVSVAEVGKGTIRIYDGKGNSDPVHTINNLHGAEITCIKFNQVFKVAISSDKLGMLEYWTGQDKNYKFPEDTVKFKYKTDTDLYELAKHQTQALSIDVSSSGLLFACTAQDRCIRVFHFLTGKKSRVFNESLDTFVELQQNKAQLPNMEFGRRIAVERELEKSTKYFTRSNCIFDESGYFLLYSTMLGVKVINLHTNRCCRVIGKPEGIRVLNIAMIQSTSKYTKAALTVDMKASDNPGLQEITEDPSIFCTAYKKNRFYIFSRRSPDEADNTADRDVFNERPTKDEVMAAAQIQTEKRISENATIHTTMGDVVVKLFATECPKATENFCVHSKNGYYNGHIFHRVIKGFMIQTGDPLGTGTGGKSIWGGEFEDEFNPSLRHDRPYTLSMANAGPNTNGSQFFITVVPTPWLDNKHTVFGRVVKGMEVVHSIASIKVHPKTDKPYDDVSIVNIAIK